MIRDAVAADHAAILAVTAAAFAPKNKKAVRIVEEIEPWLSLVWEEDDEVVGHVMLSRMRMGAHRPLQLSPLSVTPAHQGLGIGSALTREVARRADEAGEPLLLVLGHPGYYPRFGFRPAAAAGILPPNDDWIGPAWMLLPLRAYDPSLRGRVVFPPAFG